MNSIESVAKARTEFLHAKQQLCSAFETTPDERLNWSPSDTSRTPIQIVAHAAAAIENVHGILDGRPFPIKSTAEADAFFRQSEKQFTTRAQVLRLLETNSAAYLRFLDALTPQSLQTTVEMPFGLGATPMTAALDAAANHTKWHAAQIDYIQTIYGDHIWH